MKPGQFNPMFGGCIRLACTASAPLASEVKEYFAKALGCPLVEAYGMTEVTGPETFTLADDTDRTHVGGCVVNLELKLVDIPDMEYLTTDKDENGNLIPRGEICAKGFGVIPGYYKMPEKSKEALDSDGWFHTGDVG